MSTEPISFSSLEGWASDDHEAALAAFLISAKSFDAPRSREVAAVHDLIAAAVSAKGRARHFFERNFDLFRVPGPARDGLLTGYFEPEILASRTTTSTFTVPIHARPDDLVTIFAESERGSVPTGTKTHMRRTPAGLAPMPTRRELDEGALKGTMGELFFVIDEIDRFIVQVQGSAALRLPTGERVRITYDGKNGHPYTSLGRLLIQRGEISADAMSLATLVDWLKFDLPRARRTIWENESYVFFREMLPGAADAPIGVLGTQLVPGRSLAVDPSYISLGTPVYVEAPSLMSIGGQPLRRLVVAHDVGSAIKGCERGDLFVGTGDEAGQIAGAIKHPVRFTILRPKSGQR